MNGFLDKWIDGFGQERGRLAREFQPLHRAGEPPALLLAASFLRHFGLLDGRHARLSNNPFIQQSTHPIILPAARSK
ncbi:MAG TPA: hypothetical protein VNN22_10065 [Verrucomicrobiae bacterium]|nr:hypothetical protein [Verrucomicrobiae bacterium]